MVTKGRFPLVTVELALARSDQAAQHGRPGDPVGQPRSGGSSGLSSPMLLSFCSLSSGVKTLKTLLLAFSQGTCLEHSRTLDFVVGVGRL